MTIENNFGLSCIFGKQFCFRFEYLCKFFLMEGLVETLRQIQGNDNALRKEAEKRFTEAKASQPGQTVEHLFGVVESTQVEQPVREQSAVLLRQCLGKVNDADSIWSKLGAAQQQAIVVQC